MAVNVIKKKNVYLKRGIFTLFVLTLCYKGAQKLWGEHYITFFKGVIKHPLQVGAFTPCSTFVADTITKHIAELNAENKMIRILEVGAGSGVFTTKLEEILTKKNYPYHVDVIEIEPEYVTLLQKRFAANEHITIHSHDILNWKPEYSYDFILSALPFNNMSSENVHAILESYKNMISRDGIVSYIEHMGLARIKSFFTPAEQQQEYQKKRSLITAFKDTFIVESVPVWANITPVYVHHLRITK